MPTTARSKLTNRLIVSLILVPIGMFFIHVGGWPYALFITLLLGVAAWEYSHLFVKAGYRPATVLVVGGVVFLALQREWGEFRGVELTLTLLTLAAMAYHLVAYERGSDTAGSDFTLTVGGIIYLGLCGSFMISLRHLPDGKWWVLVAMPAIWLADAGAYFIGSRYGRRKMVPRLSPRKSWEGYLGGIVAGALFGALFASIWHIASAQVTALQGAWIGLIVSIFAPLGDLGESMFKRQVGEKDSSQILPGHGGIFDRIDSWIWAAVIGYYVISYLLLPFG